MSGRVRFNPRIVLGSAVIAATAACYPTTTRPATAPLAESTLQEVALLVPEATRNLAIALDADSIPVSRTEPAGGWLETGWFSATTLKSTDQRPLGPGVVKLRAWVDPSKPMHSCIIIELVYRPLADPSRDGRLLEREVADTHAVAKRVAGVLKKMQASFGEPDPTPTCASAVRPSTSAVIKQP